MSDASPIRLLVTGANRGIGLELTRQAVSPGDHVLATCRDPAGADQLQALHSEHPESLEIFALDVTSDASVAALTRSVGGRAIDVLVNNAGISGGPAQDTERMDYGAWADALSVNTMAPFRVTMAVLPALRRSSKPRVVTLSSLMGSLTGTGTGSFAYRSSKAAVNKVMQLLATEFAGAGIIVVPVHPGWVRTDMGGSDAPLTVDESVRGLLALIDRLTQADSGRFLDWTGGELPW